MSLSHNKRVKQNINSNTTTILNEFFDDMDDVAIEGTFVGKVLDNSDPDKLGRCKILVYTVFSDAITPKELPWAIPEFGFTGSLKGSFIVPQIDSFVKVTFENNEINLPKYSTKVLNLEQLPTNKDKNYPDNMVFFETDRGDSFELDRSNGETTFTHGSGTKITIAPDGAINIDSASEINVTHVKNLVVDGSFVQPTGQGPLCAIPSCLFTGAPHTGTTCLPSGAPLPSATAVAEADGEALLATLQG